MNTTCRRTAACLVLVLLPALAAPHSQLGKKQPKLPVPDAEALKPAEKLIQRLFAKDLEAAAKDRAARLQLIAKFLDNARESKEDPALQYLLYRKSLDLATQGGDLAPAAEVARQLGNLFALDGDDLLTTTFEKIQPALAGAVEQRKLVEAALALQDELLDLTGAERGRYDLAVRLAVVAEDAAKAGDDALVKEVNKRGVEMRFLAGEFKRIKGALETLKKTPADAQANLAVGRFYALVRGDWPRGLPLLAKGADGAVQALAKRELGGALTAKEYFEVAEGWEKLAGKKIGPLEVRQLLHAGELYQQAALHATGDAKAQAEARLKELAKRLPPGHRLLGVTAQLRTLDGHDQAVQGVALAPDGRRALTASADKSVRLWDVETGKELLKLDGHTNWVRAVQFSPDGARALSCGDDYTIRQWDLAKGALLNTFQNPKGWVRCVAYLPDGVRFVAGGDDRVVTLWDAKSGGVVRTFAGHTGFVLAVAVSRDGKRVLSGSVDGTARLWDVDDGKEVKKLEGHQGHVTGVALAPDGRRAVTTGADGTVRLWDVEEGRELRRFAGHKGTVWAVALTPDGKQALTAGADKTVRLWDVASGREVRRFEGLQGAAVSVAFGPGGRVALTGGQDLTARLWGEGK